MATQAPDRPKLQTPKPHRTIRDRLQKSFLERNTKLIGLIGVALIVLFTVVALLLQGGLLTGRYTVHAVFADAASIQTGDRVTVAGLVAGRVNGLTIKDGHVVMDLGVNNGVKLTRDTHAVIKIETLLGRRSVQLEDGITRTIEWPCVEPFTSRRDHELGPLAELREAWSHAPVRA